MGLRTWDKPAAACLASRIPYGTEVSVGLLSQVDRAEAALRRLGFRELRVRHYGDTARLEVPVDELDAVLARARARSSPRCKRVRVPLRDARPGGVPVGQSQRRSRTVAGEGGTFDEALDGDQLLRRVQGGGAARRRSGEGRPRSGVDRRGVQLRRDQPGRLPRREDRAGRDRHGHRQRVLAHRGADGDDRGRLRLRQRRPVHPRPRRQRAAGRSRASTACRTRSRCSGSRSTSRPAG